MKRLVDITISLIGLLLFLPLLIVTAFLVYYKFGRPIFFRQTRPGLYGRPFRLVKFRTMVDGVASSTVVSTDAERLTRFGEILRATSIDELPELWNVLCGKMSIVGPRPLLMEYLPLYTKHQIRRHEVMPGITGWAQVNGRNQLTWDERFELDVWYVDNRSIWLDAKIMLLTILRVVKREGISAPGEATMARFTGSRRAEKL